MIDTISETGITNLKSRASMGRSTAEVVLGIDAVYRPPQLITHWSGIWRKFSSKSLPPSSPGAPRLNHWYCQGPCGTLNQSVTCDRRVLDTSASVRLYSMVAGWWGTSIVTSPWHWETDATASQHCLVSSNGQADSTGGGRSLKHNANTVISNFVTKRQTGLYLSLIQWKDPCADYLG